MIVFGTMSDIRRTKYDELWFLESSMDWFVYEKRVGPFSKRPYYSKDNVKTDNYRLLMQPNVHIIDELAPNEEFYKWIKERKDNDSLYDSSITYDKYCKNYFILIDNEDARGRLNQLWELDKRGKTVLCVCVDKTRYSWRTFLIELMKMCNSNIFITSSVQLLKEEHDLNNIYNNCKMFLNNEKFK